jgi:tetratricopeptide (TPR) repeat protein
MDLDGARALVIDPRRTGSAEHRAAYTDELRARYAEISAVMDSMVAEGPWDILEPAEVDRRLELAAEVVHQLGEMIGDYERARGWGDRLLVLGADGSPARRAEVSLRLSELHRVTGQADRWAELVHGGAELLRVQELEPDAVDDLTPLSCLAFFCLGSLATHQDRADEARAHFAHAWTHGGDNDAHLWSLLIFAAVESGDERHESALAMVQLAVDMAERLGDTRSHQAARNNLACTLRWLGRHDEAYDVFASLLPEILEQDQPDNVLTGAEDFACVLFDMGRERDEAVLLGAAEREREALGVPRVPMQEEEVAATAAAAAQRVGEDWDRLLARGVELGVMASIALALRPG